jgi:hypothetical protein
LALRNQFFISALTSTFGPKRKWAGQQSTRFGRN